MLLLGLTGGIAAGKSMIATRLADLGAVVIDADLLARQAVEAGSPGLEAIADAFGPDVMLPDGTLDRPALGRVIFNDEQARARLNAIVHPAVRELFSHRLAEAPADSIVVHDVPLLVENAMQAEYHLVMVVAASEPERLRRLISERGMSREDALSRIRAQADDSERRAVADIWLDNERAPEQTRMELDRIWRQRLVPFERNVRTRQLTDNSGPVVIVAADPSWPAQARRISERIRRAGGAGVLAIDHIGSTSVPGLGAKDRIDLQMAVRSLADADEMADRLAWIGFPPGRHLFDTPKPMFSAEHEAWGKRFHREADPGRAVNLHVRVFGAANWRYALAFRDWLRAEPGWRDEYERLKRRIASEHSHDPDGNGYAMAKEPWFSDVAEPALHAWIAKTGWEATVQ
ncbi:dephospho-CoA kinase [Saxibacter everestensis]|uniref:Dephospho-CoA kinase n=1 Tax=Saxibacter everestensis TaxID=2909229 RepID=A0ABY8QY89_9MICO|nr:dephospho-CoA kinase [Brevibacteriaceae bacterium ZFBP1038]